MVFQALVPLGPTWFGTVAEPHDSETAGAKVRARRVHAVAFLVPEGEANWILAVLLGSGETFLVLTCLSSSHCSASGHAHVGDVAQWCCKSLASVEPHATRPRFATRAVGLTWHFQRLSSLQKGPKLAASDRLRVAVVFRSDVEM